MEARALSRRRILTAIGIGLVALAPPPASAGDRDRTSAVRGSSSGPASERVETVRITRSPSRAQKVAISLAPARLGVIRDRVRLRASAELTVTTTCVFREPRCRGSRYSYDPRVSARLILADGEGDTSGMKVGDADSLVCGQRRPNRNHHCRLVIRTPIETIRRASKLACAPRCHLNLVLDASHPRAGRNDRLIVGADRPDGSVSQGKGRVNALLFRPRRPARPTRSRSSRRVHRTVPIGRGEPFVSVYSVKLSRLRAGDVLDVSSTMYGDISAYPYAAFFANRLIVATSPGAVHPSAAAANKVSFGGNLSERNGFNCTQGPSWYRTPCRSRKVGLGLVKRDVNRPLYVNLIAHSFPKLTRAGANDRMRVLPSSGYLRVDRYRSSRSR